jgi:hypothetical protein
MTKKKKQRQRAIKRKNGSSNPTRCNTKAKQSLPWMGLGFYFLPYNHNLVRRKQKISLVKPACLLLLNGRMSMETSTENGLHGFNTNCCKKRGENKKIGAFTDNIRKARRHSDLAWHKAPLSISPRLFNAASSESGRRFSVMSVPLAPENVLAAETCWMA